MVIKDEALKKFFEFFDRVRGRKEVRDKVQVLADPDNLKTMSILAPNKQEFVRDAHWLASMNPAYNPLKKFAEEELETSISLKGIGREQTIRFMGALSETKLLSKLGLNIAGEPKEAKS